MVTTLQPSACTASIRQARTALPSTRMVQAPHTPCSQPTWVPVSRSTWRRQSASVMRGSTSTLTLFPLTSKYTGMMSVVVSGACALQRTLDQRSEQRLAVGGARVNVALRGDRGGCGGTGTFAGRDV